jgi:hypothetical protein
MKESTVSLEVRCEEHLAAVRAFADGLGKTARDDLESKLAYLSRYGGAGVVCRLFLDAAPYSFGFSLFRRVGEELVFWLAGGLIYHGPGSSGGEYPTLSVTLHSESDSYWKIHT